MSSPSTTASLRALVLDDREESRYLVSTWLRRAGFEVVAVGTGAEALEMINSQTFDIAVLDVNLPDMIGFEVCEHVRADPRTAAMGVVHISATAVAAGDRFEGLSRGADAYLVEPIEASDLLGTVTAIMRRVGMRETIELTAHRLRALNRCTTDVQAASDDAQLFDAALAGMVDIADGGAVIVRHVGGDPVLSRWSGGRRVDDPLDAGVVAALLEPALTGTRSLRQERGVLGASAMVGAPFVDDMGEPAGALLVPADVIGAEREVVPLLAQLAVAMSLARANINALAVEHRVALVLQESLLPAAPPEVDGGEIHFHYAASSRHAEVGGDFYEAVALDDGRLIVAIGDVVGHSLRAATVMGELRCAIRAYALEALGPEEIVIRLDRLIRRFHPGWYTTLVCGTLDMAAGTYSFCNAGHPPPLIVQPNGTCEFVETHGPLTGLGLAAPPRVTAQLPRGSRMVLVTDGLVERSGEALTVGYERLRAAAAETRDLGLAVATRRIVASVGPADTPIDDLALVLVDRH